MSVEVIGAAVAVIAIGASFRSLQERIDAQGEPNDPAPRADGAPRGSARRSA